MLVTERDRLSEDINKWAEELGKKRTSLMPILQKIQKKYNQISEYAMQVVADVINIHPVEVNSFVSFFAFLNSKPQGKYVFRLCRTISCDMAGKNKVAKQLENDLGIKFGETTPDKKFTLEWANCLGMCDQGPALLINDEIFTKVTPEMIHDIIQEFKSRFGLHSLQEKEEH